MDKESLEKEQICGRSFSGNQVCLSEIYHGVEQLVVCELWRDYHCFAERAAKNRI